MAKRIVKKIKQKHTKVGIRYDTTTGEVLAVVQCSCEADILLNFNTSKGEGILLVENTHELQDSGKDNQEHFEVKNGKVVKKSKTKRDKIDKGKRDNRMKSKFA